MLKHPPAIIALFVVGYVITFMVTMIGNSIVCYVILKIPHMRNVTNYFVFNLAVSDMLSAIFCMPFTLVDHIIRGWPFGEVMCKVFPAMQIITVAASLFTLVAIAFDRFYAVVHPTTHTFTSTVAARVIILVWAMAITLSIPIFIVQESHYQVYNDIDLTLHTCLENWPFHNSRKIFTVSLLVISYVGPLTIITILYTRVGVQVWFMMPPGVVKVRGDGQGTPMQRKVKVVKMMVAVGVLFSLSYLPIFTLMMLADFGNLSEDQQNFAYVWIYPIANWLSYINNSINPIIYGYFNRNIRKELKKMARKDKFVGDFAMSKYNSRTTSRYDNRTRDTQVGTSG
ncbi:PREDICTED: neuropeptide FF receptor 2-like [Branchiostoma belcheri]|uniref:Neuropeptide FF receptor 2-like n=1 Tax=Branchiostoma belcheri TaxID=7741 RepID=A0A6P4ZMK6_BRABE|nr:PREDICTED: neuropeptide FF receptor 2-like [Branchiostoma belcheri]